MLFCLCHFLPAVAQVKIFGTVKDLKAEPLAGVSITLNGKLAAFTNTKGYYELKPDTAGTFKIGLSYVGFESIETTLFVSKEKAHDFVMVESKNELNQVVISAGRVEQEVKRVTVSTDIIKPYLVENKVTVNMEYFMNQLPSVNVIDGQINIRSGSGWTYGAGSRVMVMLDDMPYLSGDAGQVQWKFIPVENIEQMEVIKGAASVLYGSSALNGTINIRTATPKAKPQSGITVFSGMYDKLPRDSSRWSSSARWQYGFNAFHNRKIKQLDLSTSINYLNDEGYRLGESDERLRLNWRTNYRNRKIAGLAYGINGSINTQKSTSFLLWESYAYAYTALDSSVTHANVTNLSIDPHLDFYTGTVKHKIRSRLLYTNNDITNMAGDTNDQDNAYKLWYGEYQAQLPFYKNRALLSAGLAGSYTSSNSPLYNGNNYSSNLAPFAQLDLRYKRVSVSGGIRYEQFTINDYKQSKFIKRAGVNVELTSSTFFRTSYGEGYRFPAIAERYITTSVGLLNIFANPDLKPESGWNAEAGIKQGFKVGGWQGYADMAYFYTEYDNMVEFNFGVWKEIDIANPFNSIGFKALNIGRTRITGWDFTLAGQGKISAVDIRLLAGYTYSNPVALDFDKVVSTDPYGNSYSYRFYNEDTTKNVLKYRYHHLAKADIEVGYKKFTAGISARYNSYMQNIDRIFVDPLFESASPGIKRGRELNKNGDLIMDIRAGYKINKVIQVNVVVNNLTSHEQMTRPADMRPPRMFIIQTSFRF